MSVISIIKTLYYRGLIDCCFSFLLAVIRGRDPSAVTVLLEDGAAVTGLMLATGCLGLTSYTGSPVFDAMGSVIIGGSDNKFKISHIDPEIQFQLLYPNIHDQT